jgi:hypothetical protein
VGEERLAFPARRGGRSQTQRRKRRPLPRQRGRRDRRGCGRSVQLRERRWTPETQPFPYRARAVDFPERGWCGRGGRRRGS